MNEYDKELKLNIHKISKSLDLLNERLLRVRNSIIGVGVSLSLYFGGTYINGEDSNVIGTSLVVLGGLGVLATVIYAVKNVITSDKNIKNLKKEINGLEQRVEE